jgi:hypothetical protein
MKTEEKEEPAHSHSSMLLSISFPGSPAGSLEPEGFRKAREFCSTWNWLLTPHRKSHRRSSMAERA